MALPARLAVPQRAVDARNETIEGRIGSLFATDASGNYTHPLIQQAANSVMQQFAGRGLLNPAWRPRRLIRPPWQRPSRLLDQTLRRISHKGANQDASNVFERDAGGAQENYKMSVTWTSSTASFSTATTRSRSTKKRRTMRRALAQKYALEMENVRSVNSALTCTCAASPTSTPMSSYDAATKVKLKNEAGKDF